MAYRIDTDESLNRTASGLGTGDYTWMAWFQVVAAAGAASSAATSSPTRRKQPRIDARL